MQKKHLKKSAFFHNKTHNKWCIEGIYFNIGKAICNKITANITLNVERLKAFLTTLEQNNGAHTNHSHSPQS